uniref:Phosphomevalonate kinase n=1 Tax=Eptatretus burgeri TaxID=7764 RepID=A0A8C4R8Z7_EPTBU
MEDGIFDFKSPKLLLVVSGKRKSGKDFVSERLKHRLGSNVFAILRLSEPLKSQYAENHGLNLDRLMDCSNYKEFHRADMVHWGEMQRKQDPGCFCRIAIANADPSCLIWLVSDTRRMSDMVWLRDHFGDVIETVRVTAMEATRKSRGWKFTAGIDDAESECGLDTVVSWDWIIANDSSPVDLDRIIDPLVDHIQSKLKS